MEDVSLDFLKNSIRIWHPAVNSSLQFYMTFVTSFMIMPDNLYFLHSIILHIVSFSHKFYLLFFSQMKAILQDFPSNLADLNIVVV